MRRFAQQHPPSCSRMSRSLQGVPDDDARASGDDQKALVVSALAQFHLNVRGNKSALPERLCVGAEPGTASSPSRSPTRIHPV